MKAQWTAKLFFHDKALFTHNIFAHNIAMKRYCNKKIFFSSKYCSYISKSYQINRKTYFQFTRWKKYWLKNIYLSQYLFYLFIAILCVKMSRVNKALGILPLTVSSLNCFEITYFVWSNQGNNFNEALLSRKLIHQCIVTSSR